MVDGRYERDEQRGRRLLRDNVRKTYMLNIFYTDLYFAFHFIIYMILLKFIYSHYILL